MRERFLAFDRPVAPSERPGKGGARRCKSLKTQPRQNMRGTGILRIGYHKRARPLMKRLEALGFFGLVTVMGSPSRTNW